MKGKRVLMSNNLTQNKINEELINNFVNFLDVAPKTAQTYCKAMKQIFNFLRGHGIKTPTRESIIAFKKELQGKGRKASTIALYLSSARRFFSWTEQSGIYPNIARDVKAPKIDKGHKKDYFTSSQLKSILTGIDRSNIEGMRNYAMLSLMVTGGLRTIEISRAKIEDLRTVGGVPVLFIQGKGKTSKSDFVKLCPKVDEAIRTYLKIRGYVDTKETLFASLSKRNMGQSLTTRSVRGIAKLAMLDAGFNSNKLTAHSLRHSAVTLALLGGETLEEVQHFARHSNISTTQIYAHNIDRMKSTCENTIANSIF
ncbi:MAG: tyrosine-type recombinase/integrase [Synergistaceae bacterium]|nr:tyrosine-type recombinase/integrase [Synergistaceae bacterium]MBR0253220.1 tyrosine-type recombinase/integrase [Synergistaceae bacterium]